MWPKGSGGWSGSLRQIPWNALRCRSGLWIVMTFLGWRGAGWETVSVERAVGRPLLSQDLSGRRFVWERQQYSRLSSNNGDACTLDWERDGSTPRWLSLSNQLGSFGLEIDSRPFWPTRTFNTYHFQLRGQNKIASFKDFQREFHLYPSSKWCLQNSSEPATNKSKEIIDCL